MIVSIASDHAGYELRQKVIKHLQEKGFEVLDGGAPNGTDSYSYVDAGVKVAEDVISGRADRESLSAVPVSAFLLSAISTRESDVLFATMNSWLRCADSITMPTFLPSARESSVLA